MMFNEIASLTQVTLLLSHSSHIVNLNVILEPRRERLFFLGFCLYVKLIVYLEMSQVPFRAQERQAY